MARVTGRSNGFAGILNLENWQFMKTGIASSHSTRAGHALAVLTVFLKLGLTCFGGAIAHLGYFRREFVERRHWLDDETFTDLVGLCQFLPGPASSQVGFSIGLLRAGWLGGSRPGVGSRYLRFC
jgi:chromate transporter